MRVRPYLVLLHAFVEERLSADEFETLYLFMFKNDQDFLDEPIYEVLNSLFGDVDAYCSNDLIRGPGDLDSSGLLDSAQRALGALVTLTEGDDRKN